ncbi:MAG: potassium channel family protein, partial [Ilumatobacter sp.]|nr:potassium channel family protein [Ilumatobacter sp.]
RRGPLWDHVVMGILRRGYERFHDNPSSLRHATQMITSLTVAVVLLGALMMWVFDHGQYPTYGSALWFTLQTVTTVGYGDATPISTVGKTVAAVVMLTAIGLVTVVTARVTSTFIEAARVRTARANAEAASPETDPFTRLDSTLSTLVERLDQIESTLAERLDQIESTLAVNDATPSESRDSS